MLFCSCQNDIEKIKSVSSSEEPTYLTADNFEMIYSDSTVIRFKLTTPKLIVHQDPKDPFYEFPEGVHIEKFDERMVTVSNISAKYARNYMNDKRWEAKNNVVAVNAQGDTLKTELLIWDEQKEKISSDQFVKIIRKDQIMTGIGFESDQDLSNWHIKRPKGTIFVEVEK